MRRTVSVSFSYAAPPEKVWRINTTFDTFRKLMARVARFDGFPARGSLQQGAVYDVGVRLFGCLPAFAYRIEMLELDAARFHFRSRESGGVIRDWRHVSDIVPDGTGCRLTDTVDADAGALTPLLPPFIRFVFHSRHAPRLAMISDSKES